MALIAEGAKIGCGRMGQKEFPASLDGGSGCGAVGVEPYVVMVGGLAVVVRR